MKKKLQSKMLLAMVAILIGASGARAAVAPVCERTPVVREFLELQVKKKCAEISEADLASVKRVAVPRKNVTQFKLGDFSGLANLEVLNIQGNPFRELPAGLMRDLRRLKTLVIFRTQLVNLPADFIENMEQIENLHMFENPFTTISESVFARLANLKTLRVLDVDAKLGAAERNRIDRLFPAGGPTEVIYHEEEK